VSDTATSDPRISAAGDVLRRAGIAGFHVDVAGHARDIAVLHAPPDALARLADLAPEIKALGFRYVAVDLAPAE